MWVFIFTESWYVPSWPSAHQLKPGGPSNGATLGTSWSRTRANPTSMWPGRCWARDGTRRLCLRRRRTSSPRWDFSQCQKSFGKEAFWKSQTMAGKKYPCFAIPPTLTFGQHVEVGLWWITCMCIGWTVTVAVRKYWQQSAQITPSLSTHFYLHIRQVLTFICTNINL